MQVSWRNGLVIIESDLIGQYLSENDFVEDDRMCSNDRKTYVFYTNDLIFALENRDVREVIKSEFTDRVNRGLDAVDEAVKWYSKITAELDFLVHEYQNN